MPSDNTPEDGDFAAYLARHEVTSNPKGNVPPQDANPEQEHDPALPHRRQSIEDVVVHGEEPTQAFLEELSALETAPDLSEEELAKQALEHPGNDGDPSTPE